jgi:hypothetical protein
MNNFNAWPGLNDHIHGDEHYRDYLGPEAIDQIDVILAIDSGTATNDGMSHYEWCKRIAESDEMYSIIKRIVKNRHNPAFAELANDIELAIEGWLP